MIDFEHVTKRYGEKTAVSDLTLNVDNGTVCALIGPSGCGKSTTLKMINRLLEPDSGTIRVDDRALRDYDPAELRLRVGYVIQSVGLLPHMRVWQNISLVPRLLKWTRARQRSRAEELLELVGLDPAQYRDVYPRRLSGGEAQRVGVARALAADPPYLLMDEPFGAVDPLTRVTLQEGFREIQQRLRKTVVLVTHDLDEALYLGDRIALMKDGELHQFGSAAEILTNPADDFVRQFVGTDSPLRLLNTMTMGGITLRDALSQLLTSKEREIEIDVGDGRTERIDFERLREKILS